jgi:aminopeptidase N
MEHQTLVAYGAMFTDNDFGFDELLLHEVAHEWWGNKITVSDWADFWIHEGFATYAEALYVGDTLGEERYLDYMRRIRQRVRNRKPIVLGEDMTSAQAYSGDIYMKGAWVLHTLRWLLGDQDFFKVIWRFADGDHPDACRLVSNEDLEALVGEVSGRDLGWFWERYLHRAKEPRWRVKRSLHRAKEPRWRVKRRSEGDRERVEIRWDDSDFELPLPVVVGGEEQRLEMPGGRASFLVERGTVIEIDPDGRILAQPLER